MREGTLSPQGARRSPPGKLGDMAGGQLTKNAVNPKVWRNSPSSSPLVKLPMPVKVSKFGAIKA